MASSHMGVDITPATLADGSLHSALDPKTTPELGDTAPAAHGALLPDAAPGSLVATPATTGGTLAAGTYGYDVTAVGLDGESEPASVDATTTGATGKVTLTWTAPTDETAGFRVYRDGEHLANVAHGTLTYVDNGGVTPAGDEPDPEDIRGRLTGETSGAGAPQPVDPAPDAYEPEGGLSPKAVEDDA